MRRKVNNTELTEYTNTYYGLGENPNENIIQKSLPLLHSLRLTKKSLSFAEFRLLDLYLSRIDSHKPQNKTVIFNKKELEEVFGTKQIRVKDLNESLYNLVQKATLYDIRESSNPNAMLTFDELKKIYNEYNDSENDIEHNIKMKSKFFPMFSQAELDIENGQIRITLECNEKAEPYIFNIEGLKYIRYKLQNIIKLRSKYSYNLFLYLENNKFRKQAWTISIEEFEVILGCEKTNFKTFSDINRVIFTPAIKNVNLDTSRHFNYKFKRTGKIITHIEFELIKECDRYIEAEMNNEELFEIDYLLRHENYTKEEKENIYNVLTEIPVLKLMEYIPQDMDKDNIDIKTMQYFYAKHCYNILEKQKNKKEIANELKYYLIILKNNYKDKKESVKEGRE